MDVLDAGVSAEDCVGVVVLFLLLLAVSVLVIV